MEIAHYTTQKKTLKKKKYNNSSNLFVIPDGWIFIDKEFLSERSRDLDNNSIITFFNGRSPIWREALCPKIPRRGIVQNIGRELNETNELKVTLLTGAGGEGKTTVFLQIISDLVNLYEHWGVLWINDTSINRPWPTRFLRQLQKDKFKWLIACDDADLVAKHLFNTVKSFYKEERNDIQFLLCCRDTDWISARANEWNWNSYCSFTEKRMRGISSEDCDKIIEGWDQLGADGMGRLYGLDLKEAANRLLIASKSEEQKYEKEGAFYGAMLRVRIGDELKNHLIILLNRLKEKQILKTNLLEAFAYIVAMHSEGLSILTKDVLAETLNCRLGDIKRYITGPLGDEAATAIGGNHIYTRHRAIAETSVEILSEIYHFDFDEIYIELAEAALLAYNKGVYISDLGKWRFLSSHFFNQGNRSLAIRLNKALLKIDPSDVYLIVHLSKLFRNANEPLQASKIFRDNLFSVEDRPFFYEWAVTEGNNDNHAISIWFSGIALSDQIQKRLIDNKTATFCLSGMALAFSKLFEKYNNISFIESCGAVAILGLRLKLGEQDISYFQHLVNRSKNEGVANFTPIGALNIMKKGIIQAWKQAEEEMPEWVLSADQLTFEGFAMLLQIESSGQ
ncbi:hypothetical protein DENIS_3843 [Desulfonema ishimotonii]|uniref:Novel STAND NTPase 5 domain-containing protein n=1 Tax=Desulfonema ishimotonii TaxID=45657 RepID=A0A401G0W0_9BACT|nr:hypothetical protein [Desulfonema ishimotonii]GBC62859.1 hypothetical protein DENIS_3843 [Desulfonema ishimotonii]